MKLYNSIGPNPKIVRMFLAEKGVGVELVEVDVMGGENRRPPYAERVNRMGQLPALELDDGRVICEVVAICEYLEEVHPEPPLIGAAALDRAEARMWARRVDLNVIEPMVYGFRGAEGRAFFEGRMPHLLSREAAEDMKKVAAASLQWLDRELGAGPFLAGDRFTHADVMLFCMLEFGGRVGQPLSDEHRNLKAWFERVKARPSASA